jgi:hypothetical protein
MNFLPFHVLEIPGCLVPRVVLHVGRSAGRTAQLAWPGKVSLCLDIEGVRLVSYWGQPKKEQSWSSSPKRADHVKGQV